MMKENKRKLNLEQFSSKDKRRIEIVKLLLKREMSLFKRLA